MRLPALLAALALVAAAGCVKDEPVADAAVDEEAVSTLSVPAEPTPSSPSSPPPSSTPPPAARPSPAPAPEPEPEPEPAPTPPRIEVRTWEGTMTAVGASASGQAPTVCCPQAQLAGENIDSEFEVPALQGLIVELVWAAEEFDLDLVLEAPDFDGTPAPPETSSGHRWIAGGGAPGDPDLHASIVLTEAEALALTGSWTWRVAAKGPANEVPFTVHVSLFYDAPPSEGYTAVVASEADGSAGPSGNP